MVAFWTPERVSAPLKANRPKTIAKDKIANTRNLGFIATTFAPLAEIDVSALAVFVQKMVMHYILTCNGQVSLLVIY